MFSKIFTAGLACIAPFAAAYTTPVGDIPKGNPISKPGLNSVVPVNEPYTITWDPTTAGTVSLVLLKGPSTNIKPLYAIGEKIPNSGSFSWTPRDSLEPGQTGYGIQLIDDATGQYQYTTQFGISNPDYSSSSSSSSSAMSAPTYGAPPAYSSSAMPIMTASSYMMPSSSAVSSNTTMTKSATKMPMSTGAPVTGYPAGNSSIVMPSGTMSVPSSLKTTASMNGSSIASATGGVPAPSATGAASNVAASIGGLILAAGVAAFAL